MATEIFIEPELQELENADTASEWFEICGELGLQKQLKHADKSEEKKAPPYMYVDPKTQKIMKILCPREEDFRKYSASTIPLDVLKEIQKCVKNGWYASIKIMYDDKSPDPFVIGLTKNEDNWRRHIHLIARWGGELIPFEQLEEKAIRRLKDEVADTLNSVKIAVTSNLENVEGFIRSLLNGKMPPNYNFGLTDISTYVDSSDALPF